MRSAYSFRIRARIGYAGGELHVQSAESASKVVAKEVKEFAVNETTAEALLDVAVLREIASEVGSPPM